MTVLESDKVIPSPKINRTKVSTQDLIDYESLDIAVLFAHAYNTWVKAIEKILRPFDITTSQSVALRALKLAGGTLLPTDIYKLLPVEQSAVSLLLDKLEKRKLVRRRRGARNDKRNVEIFLTARGEQLIDTMTPLIIELHNHVFESLSTRERSSLRSISTQIRDICLERLEISRSRAMDTEQMIIGPEKPKPVSRSRNKKSLAKNKD